MTGRRSHGRLSALNGVVHQGSSKMVPAVTEVRPPQLAHMMRRSLSDQRSPWPQPGQAKPSGHRSQSR